MKNTLYITASLTGYPWNFEISHLKTGLIEYIEKEESQVPWIIDPFQNSCYDYCCIVSDPHYSSTKVGLSKTKDYLSTTLMIDLEEEGVLSNFSADIQGPPMNESVALSVRLPSNLQFSIQILPVRQLALPFHSWKGPV
jgi:hypothetical protein